MHQESGKHSVRLLKKVSLTYSNHRLATDNVWDTGIALQYMYVDMVKGRHVTLLPPLGV